MIRRILGGVLLLSLIGCVDKAWLHDHWAKVKGEPDKLTPVTANPFVHTTTVRAPGRPAISDASLESAARVDMLGRQILAANQQLGVKPLFVTIAGPEPELFHIGTSEIYITEALVKRCATESQLAAVLCHELGKMIAARELRAGPELRTPDRQPPQEMRVGNDHAGGLGTADQIHRAELAKFEKERRLGTATPPPPNPRSLAESCLYRAGHDPRELDAVAPLLKEAADNTTFAKQLTGTPPVRSWTR
jgi:Peptidase family M48